jgi:hypothetical protein
LVGGSPGTALVELVLEQLRILPNDVDDLSGTLAGYLKLNRTDLRALTLVRITPKAERAFARALAKLQDDWIRVLATYRADEVQVVLRFVSDYRRLVRGHSRRLSRTIS